VTPTATPTVTPTVTSTPGADLNVTAIEPNVGAGAALFANEPNVLTVTVKNQGTGDAGSTTLQVAIGSSVQTAVVPPLAANTSTRINVTDSGLYAGGTNLAVTATVDLFGLVTESDEANNVYTTVLTVRNNGYKGKRWTGGGDLVTQAGPFDGHVDLVYSAGNSVYAGANWTEKTVTWTTGDLPIPAGATVASARLYQSYNYNKKASPPAYTLSFNGNPVTPEATYTDRKGFGSYDYPYGLYVFDVTGAFDPSGNSMTITPESGNDYSINGAYLVVVYRDANATEKTIWINDGYDMLQSQAQYSVSTDEATAFATFAGVDATGVAHARAIAVLASANENGKSRFFFNGDVYTGFWPDYLGGPQIGFSSYDVTSALADGANTARLQSVDPGTKGDNMYAMNTILVVERSSPTVTPTATPTVTQTPGGPVANFTASPTSGYAPLYVRFTDRSENAVRYVWSFGDGSLSYQQHPARVYRNPGTYTVTLTVYDQAGASSATSMTITVTEKPVVTTTTVTPTPTATTIAPTPSATPTVTPVQQPYPDRHDLPGVVQAEDYDTGGAGVAYSDTTPGNQGGAYRSDDVDIEVQGTVTNVGWIRRGEWLSYTVDTTDLTAGAYQIRARYAAPSGQRPIAILVDGTPVATLTLPATGGYAAWSSALSAPFTIPKGRHVVTLRFDESERFNLDYLEFLKPDVVTTTPTPQPGGAGFTAAPNPVRKGALIRFTLQPAPGRTVRSVWWTFDRDGHYSTWNSRNVNPGFFYPAAGTYTPLVKITYTDGSVETVERTGYVRVT